MLAFSKVKKIMLYLTLLPILVSSCSKDMDLFTKNPNDLYRVGEKRYISAEAGLPKTTDKVFMDYVDGMKVKWDADDQLNVNGMNITESYMHSSTYANFEGTVYGLTSRVDLSKEIYWAVYPTNLAGSYSSAIPTDFQEDRLLVNFPSSQIYDSTLRVLDGDNYMAGYAKIVPGSHLHFNMKNLCTVLRIELTAAVSATNKHVSRLEFYSSSSRLSGRFNVDTTGAVSSTPDASNNVTVYLSNGTHNYIDISNGAVVYVMLPAINTGNLSMKIFNTDEYCTTKTSSSLTTLQNHLYTNTLTDIDFDETSPAYYSVSPIHQVTFSPGNLQWSYTNGGNTATTHAVATDTTERGTFRFAEHQWNFVGNVTKGNVYGKGGNPNDKCSNTNINYNYSGWLDLFGWGTSGWNSGTYSFSPWSKSGVDSNYRPGRYNTNNLTGAYAYADWGIYNEIYNPKTGVTDPAGTWRTPTNDEWVYLCSQRSTPSGARYAKAIVNGVNGLLLFPDRWDPNTYTINSVNIATVNYSVNVISLADFQILDDKGVVFLPAGGNRTGQNVNETGDNGSYWSSTSYDRDKAHGLYFGYDKKYGGLLVGLGLTHGRSHGRCVRLVHDEI